MKLLMILSSMVSMFYMSSSHPVLLMAFILAQTAGICVMAWVKLKISWFSYILFLIFLGGLMVLFIYITSLASNEMITLNVSMLSAFTASMILIFLVMFYNSNSQQTASAPMLLIKTFHFMYSWNLAAMVMLTMVYLLLTLIIVVKISNKFEAPLKNLIFN